jgi:hypothetical protein
LIPDGLAGHGSSMCMDGIKMLALHDRVCLRWPTVPMCDTTQYASLAR